MKLSLLSICVKRRELLIELVRREFYRKYKGSVGGVAWSIFQPLVMLGIYTIAFGVIIQGRWGDNGDTSNYSLWLYAGLIILNAVIECLNKSVALIIENPNYVKKIVFPLELLSVANVIAILVHLFINLMVWLVVCLVLVGFPPLTIVYVPFVFLCLIPLMLGISWLLSALSVFFRDIAQVVGMLGHVLLFLTPIFYSVSQAPAFLHRFLLFNPLTYLVETFRGVLIYGASPNALGLIAYFAVSLLFCSIGYWTFKRLKPAFGDVI